MDTPKTTKRGHWGSRLGFVLAASGSAVGLGNLWKFPYLAYSSGGGATDQRGAGGFVLLYLIAVVAVGLPIMMSEILIGRRTGRNPVGAFKKLRPGSPWKAVGALGVLTGFLLLSYYNVVAGWTIEYSIKSVTNEFGTYASAVSDDDVKDALWKEFKRSPEALATLQANGFAAEVTVPAEEDPDQAVVFRQGLAEGWTAFENDRPEALETTRAELTERLWTELQSQPDFEEQRTERQKALLPSKLFGEFVGNPWKQVGWAFAFMLLSVLVVLGGVAKGIERWTKILMPTLLVLLIGLLVRMLTLEGAGSALTFLFRPNFEHMDSSMVLNALGQAFFSLSLGMGAIITYGSYLSRKENIAGAAASVTFMDTAIALVASIIIFSAIFSYGLVMEDGGAGNLFTAIPVIFLKIPGGTYLCIAFYLLIMFAALTSTISLLETVVSYLIDERGWSRVRATLSVAATIFAIGVPAALSFSVLSDATIFGKTWFDLSDYLCANWFLPVGGLGVAVFTGWVLTRDEQREELPESQIGSLFSVWRFLVRWVAPAAVLAVLIGIIVGRVQAG